MTTQLIPTQPGASTLTMTDEHTERFKRYEVGRRSKSTVQTYERLMRGFRVWCVAKGVSPCPANPQTVWTYLDEMASRAKPVAQSTLTSIKAAIQYEHQRQRQPDPFLASGMESQTLALQFQGMRRELAGRRPRRATALTLEQLEAVFEAINTAEPVGLRDACAMAIAVFNADRRSEIVSLLIEDVQWDADGALITLRKSKTDQLGQGATLIAPTVDGLIDPGGLLRHWMEWLSANGVTRGPLIREVRRHKGEPMPVNTGKADDAISGNWFNVMVKRYAKAAKIELPPGAHVSSHSLRRSAATLVARTGASAMQVAEFGRWSDPRTVQRTYLQDNAAERIKLAQRTFVNGE
jgi:integrase